MEALRGLSEGDAVSEVIRLGLRRIIEEALKVEVADGIGRGYYERGAEGESGYRNGYRRGRLKTAEGQVEYAVPQVSDRGEPFRSRIREQLPGRTAALEDLAVEMYARGLSTRDIGRPRGAASVGAAAAGGTERLGGSAPTARRFFSLAPGTKDDTESCKAFFQDMRRRGLPDPLLVVTNGAPGLIRVVEECFPRSLRQRCLAHRMRNLVSESE